MTKSRRLGYINGGGVRIFVILPRLAEMVAFAEGELGIAVLGCRERVGRETIGYGNWERGT